ncbi:MAG: SDR family oxidoreductase [Pseudomonadota bacterium]
MGTALITGASSGIGEELASCFAEDGYALVLVARSADKLEALAGRLRAEHGVPVTVAPADLAQKGAAAKLLASLKRKKISVDVLVNNAGVLEAGAFTGMAATRHQELIALNICGLTDMLAHFVPPMVERGHGRVLNVASIAAFQPVPSLATYAATKAYVLSLTESLSEELKDSGVTVTALCPGITATNMVSMAQQDNATLSQLPGFVVGDAAEVARQGFEACMDGDVVKVPGMLNLAGTLAARATPKWLVRRVTGMLGRQAIKGR